MAFLTRDAGVFPSQWEFGLTVVESLVGDGVPVHGSMTGGAGRLVQHRLVRRFVTGAAVIERLRPEINGRSFFVVLHPVMAFLTWHGDMFARKRETGHAVIESLGRGPAVGSVAVGTHPVAGKFRFVRRTMAGSAVFERSH